MNYVVMERGFEYNDEYYTEQEGGTPVKVFTSKEEAEKHRQKLEDKKRESLSRGGRWTENIGDYCGDCAYQEDEVRAECTHVQFYYVVPVG